MLQLQLALRESRSILSVQTGMKPYDFLSTDSVHTLSELLPTFVIELKVERCRRLGCLEDIHPHHTYSAVVPRERSTFSPHWLLWFMDSPANPCAYPSGAMMMYGQCHTQRHRHSTLPYIEACIHTVRHTVHKNTCIRMKRMDSFLVDRVEPPVSNADI